MYTGTELEGVFDRRKALIVPILPDQRIFIQDRRGYKKPDWGYFGGSIEGTETPLQAVIRETEEELLIKLKESDLIYLGISTTDYEGKKIIRYMYLYPTANEQLTVLEGKGGLWMKFEEVRELFEDANRFDDVVERIKEVLKELGTNASS